MASNSPPGAAFDPYLKWLGIAPRDQPPHHYRLLGIDPYIADADVIENAADQRMRHLRTFSSGEHVEVAQRLLNELATAKVCLLNPQKKAAYDAELKARLDAQQARTAPPQLVTRTAPPLPRAVPLQPATPAAMPFPADPDVFAGHTAAPTSGTLAKRRKKSSSGVLVVLALGAAVIVGALVVHKQRADEEAALQRERVATKTSSEAKKAQKNGGDEAGTSVPGKKSPASGTKPRPPKIKARSGSEIDEDDDTPLAKAVLEEDDKLPAVGEVDLLAGIDLQRDTIRGEWDRDARGLVSPGPADRAQIIVSRLAPEEFELRLRVERMSGRDALFVSFPIAGKTVGSYFDWANPEGVSESGFQYGVVSKSANPILEPGRVQNVSLVVTRTKAILLLNGSKLVEQPAPFDQVRLGEEWAAPNNAAFTVGSLKSSFRILSARLAPLDGAAMPTERLSPPRKPRVPAPSDEDLTAALKVVDEIYAERVKGATKPEEKVALALEICQKADEGSDDAAARFALLRRARDLCVAAGHAAGVMEVYDRLAESFEFDDLAGRSTSLQAAGKNAKKPAEYREVALAIGRLAAQLADADRFDEMPALTKLAQSAAAAARDIEFRKEVASGVKRMGQLKEAYDNAEKARKTLADKPDDPAANQVVGEYLCLVKRNWPEGLPHLAKGTDGLLKKPAENELAKPADVAARLALADAWWDAAQAYPEDSPQRHALLSHVEPLYDKSLFEATGLNKTRIEKRIADIRDAAALDPLKGGRGQLARATVFMKPESWRTCLHQNDRWVPQPFQNTALKFDDGEMTIKHPVVGRGRMLVALHTAPADGDIRVAGELRGRLYHMGLVYSTGEDRTSHSIHGLQGDAWHPFVIERIAGKVTMRLDDRNVDVATYRFDNPNQQVLFFFRLDEAAEAGLRRLVVERP